MRAFRLLAPWVVFLLDARAAIRFDDFRSTEQLNVVGAAEISGAVVRLTPAKRDQAGAAWLRLKQPVAAGFETSFDFRLTQQGGMGRGADGFAFVLQNAGPDAIGGRGSAGGFAVTDPNYQKKEDAIPWSIAVFFDTFRNEGQGDPSANYVAICVYGKPDDARWPAPRLAYTRRLPVHLKDRKVHTARILFQPPVLSVFLDNAKKPALRSVADLSVVLDAEGSAWVGFTASTGAGWENHDILNWTFGRGTASSDISVVSSQLTFLPSVCLPDRNLCTPDKAVVEPSGDGFHIILPGNLEWGASIPNPAGRKVRVSSPQGIVCWDFEQLGTGGCSGASGAGESAAGPGYLDPGAPPGALIVRTREGRSSFSVNGKIGQFGRTEGFYEFHAAFE